MDINTEKLYSKDELHSEQAGNPARFEAGSEITGAAE